MLETAKTLAEIAALLDQSDVNVSVTEILTTPKCMICGERSAVEITTAEALLLFAKREDGRPKHLIQDALPDRDADFRELVKTGTHPACWTAMFGDDDE